MRNAAALAAWFASACAPVDGHVDLADQAATACVGVVSVADREVCLGVSIGDGWVLTAKHCVQVVGAAGPVEASGVVVQRDGVPLEVVEVVVLGGAYESLGELAGYDLALLRTSPGEGADSCALAREASPIGSVFATQRRDGLRVVAAPVVTLGTHEIITESVTCDGDSGGPLLTEDGSVVGVASWRSTGPCTSGRSVFTRVEPHLDWIESTIGANAR